MIITQLDSQTFYALIDNEDMRSYDGVNQLRGVNHRGRLYYVELACSHLNSTAIAVLMMLREFTDNRIRLLRPRDEKIEAQFASLHIDEAFTFVETLPLDMADKLERFSLKAPDPGA
ncbi:hypothetical protein [Magnetofaba australis]|uniref:hypothetical protein n=1 Tax=Magnetofaba australis TaxID=1472297 RepID=UPI000A19F6DD|nr:hypothetical protein [Magnetofaba australis]